MRAILLKGEMDLEGERGRSWPFAHTGELYICVSL